MSRSPALLAGLLAGLAPGCHAPEDHRLEAPTPAVTTKHPPARPDPGALGAALRWLLEHQASDGSWGSGERRVEDTSLAALSLLAEGNTLDVGPHREPLGRAVRWLARHQDGEGVFRDGEAVPDLGGQAAALLAVSEARVLSGGAHGLEGTVGRGAGAMARALEDWNAPVALPEERGAVDAAWGLAALTAARDAGSSLDERLVDATLDRVRFQTEATALRSAASLFAGAITGAGVLEDEGAPLLDRLPGTDDGDDSAEYWYFGSLAAFQHGGELWRAWQPAIGASLAASQLEDGSFPGSGSGDDRVRSTALGAMTLAVQWRYARVLAR
ncbi:hypothetical protein OAF73_00620 [Planctomycetota bacterium]|nr:hypothetical protein [Planctomycetota bacterium]